MPFPANPRDPSPPRRIEDPRITIGRHTYGLVRKSFHLSQPWDRVNVGSFCSFAAEVGLLVGAEHQVGVTSFPLLTKLLDPEGGHIDTKSKGPLTVGNDCWVGWRAIVLGGVAVGDGAIIGAGSVVTRDVPPYAVVGGNPARLIRMRFDERTVERLLAVRWWDWDDETLASRGHLFSDVGAFLAVAEQGPPPPAPAAAPRPSMPSPHGLYLDLLAKSLVGLLAKEPRAAEPREDGAFDVVPLDDLERRRVGRDWPVDGETMVGLRRLENVRACVEDVLARHVSGDIIEAGVWRGGTTIFMRGILAVHGAHGRRVWVADSFQGLPRPDADAYPADSDDRLHRHSFLAVPQEEVRESFDRYGLLDDQVKFLPGWFRDTLPSAEGPFAVIRLDGDMYESTIVALEHLYPKLTPGGYLIVDDYHAVPSCRKAVDDYRRQHEIEEAIVRIDWTGVFWRKERAAPA